MGQKFTESWIKNCTSVDLKAKVSAVILFVFMVILPILSYSQTGKNSKKPSLQEGTLTLKRCIDYVLSHSSEIIDAEWYIREAEIDLKDVRSSYLPKIDLSGSYTLSNQFSNLISGNKPYSISLSSSVTPYNGGKTRINILKRRALLNNAKVNLRIIKIQVIIETIEKYINVLKMLDILELKNESLSQKKYQLELSQEKFRLGLIPKTDVLKTEVDLKSAEVDVLDAKGNLQMAKAQLNNLLGFSLDHDINCMPLTFAVEAIPPFDVCLNEAIEHRPEVTQKKAQITINQTDVKLAKKEKAPLLKLSGSYDIYIDKVLSENEGSIFSDWNENTTWSISLGVVVPLFEGGVTRRAIEKSNIELRRAERDYKDTVENITLELKTAYQNLVQAKKKVELTDLQVKTAGENYSAALESYKSGIGSITDVIDAEMSLTSSKITHTNALYECLLDYEILKKNMGKLTY